MNAADFVLVEFVGRKVVRDATADEVALGARSGHRIHTEEGGEYGLFGINGRLHYTMPRADYARTEVA